MKKLIAITVMALLGGCSTYMPQRYSINADNNVALKTLKAGNINVGPFRAAVNIDSSCRAAGPISPPDNLSFEGYIQKALADELKVAGAFNDKTPSVILTGTVEQLGFSSSRGLTGGAWDIGLRVTSSNGKFVYVSEHYEFNSGFVADTACKQTAEAYLPAVQNLIGNLIKSPQFKALITP